MRENKLVTYLKMIISLFICLVLFAFTVKSSLDSIDLYNQLGDLKRVRFAGLLNNISSWILSGFLLFLFICLLYRLITKKIIPLPIGTFLLLFSIIGGVIGLVLDSMTREKVKELGYQECKNEAYFSRNASHKIYVLSQADCEVK
ncbi:hypothetical protein [uncultured Shewanella sp.]|uniref:hypothetical protein n=1 Tax=uncultured Shewanella sp. TaxID=173975 RepID=UPI0026162B89|nr:hypothetical protein [uncultured Shewanella sp.]